MQPLVRDIQDEAIWTDFFDKYLLLTREFIHVSLRNISRQNRGAKRFCRDLSILIAEANFTDEAILAQRKMPLK